MTFTKEEISEKFHQCYHWRTRDDFEKIYAEESQRAERGIGLTRLKDVKDFWLVMAIKLPQPTFSGDAHSQIPWLYDIDWHFDRFDQGLVEYGTRVPNEILGYIQKASAGARQLFNDGQTDPASSLMFRVFSLSWTRKDSLPKWAKQFDD
ncbi:hypothetical protein [uncultured Erythrobacter sp.]|uniref:hypothetical protein n=1 Tax=uncultured Erythrobacter sp. TaxID=263913 RepID=UPI002616AB75|nr:hypothetical protein [uncultured Erythrobacter sp.]